MRGRAKQKHIHGSSPVHTHDDQIGALVRSPAEDLPIRAALDARRFHRAVGLRFPWNQFVQTTAYLGDRGRASTVEIDFKGRRLWTDHPWRLDDMQDGELRVGFLGDVDGVRERAE